MRIFLWIVALFFIAIGLAVGARFDPGNVVFFYPPTRVDLSLNLFLLLALAVFLALHFILNAINTARELPGKVAAYRKEKREREGNRALRDALKALFEGRFGHAEKFAKRALESSENAGLAALIAARAVHRMQQFDRRDLWLSAIQDDIPLKTARLMTSIELLVDDHQPELALAAVKELNASGTRHIHALRLALKANQRARNWPEVLRLVRSLDNHHALHPALSRRLRELGYEDLLRDPNHDAESIRHLWQTVPVADRVQAFVALRAAETFNALDLRDEARAIVERALEEEWDRKLLSAYRKSAALEGTPALLAQIERCESWSVAHANDAELALTLGVLCLRQKLWGKAQRQLELALFHSRELPITREAHLKLAQMHESLNQAEQAAAHYKQCAQCM